MTIDEFCKKARYAPMWDSYVDRLRSSDDHLPCFAHRISVVDGVNTPALIKELIKHSCDISDNDVLVFSVTEQDKCWNVWKEYAITNPKTFKVVEGGSIHGVYMCRMYIYTKPAKKRKFHADNIGGYRRR